MSNTTLPDRTIRDWQIRINSLGILGELKLEPLVVDGKQGAKTRHAIEMVQQHYGYTTKEEIFFSSQLSRVHWHWAASSYNVTEELRSHYNLVVDSQGDLIDGGAPPLQQAHYIPGKVGVSHTLNANTGAIGISMACMGNASTQGNLVDMGKYPMTWKMIDSMLEATVDYCKRYDIKVSAYTTLSHAEVQENLGIRQNGKWDIRVLPDNPTKLLGAREAGDRLRTRMVEKFW